MPEWLIERGIGESRFALVEGEEILEARVALEGQSRAGAVVAARLVHASNRNAVARDGGGQEYLLPKGATAVTEGAALNIQITREAIPGGEPWKRPLACVTDQPTGDAPDPQARELALPSPRDPLAGWNDLIDQARTGVVRFAGGELRISPTAAMTLIDVDGFLEPNELVLRGAAEAAKAIRRLDIGGSIGIDLPTTANKAARQEAAAAIDANLPQPFERTAVNGFGFVQLLRPRMRPSLVELAQDRAAFEARALLRCTAFEAPGHKRLVAHPAVIAVLERKSEWIARLERQVGGTIGLRADAAVAMSAGYAEHV